MDPRFTEEQVQKILARSFRLQEASISETEKNKEGFSVAELEEIAREVGISPEFLSEALKSNIDSFVVSEKKSMFGGTKLWEISGNVRSEISEDAKYEILQLLRKRLTSSAHDRGKIENIGNSFEWLATEYTLSAKSTGGETDLKLVHRAANAKLLYNLFPILFASIIVPMSFGLGTLAFGLGVLTLFVAISIAANMAFLRALKRKKHDAKEVFQLIEEIIMAKSVKTETSSSMSSSQNSKSADPEAESRIDLSAAEGFNSAPIVSKSDSKKRIIP